MRPLCNALQDISFLGICLLEVFHLGTLLCMDFWSQGSLCKIIVLRSFITFDTTFEAFLWANGMNRRSP